MSSIKPAHIIADTLCITLSAALVFGQGGPAHDFAYYVLLIMISMAAVGLLVGAVEGSTAQSIRDRVWWSGLLSGVQIAALVLSGHPLLAAVNLVVSMLIVGSAFRVKTA